ncbi:beta-ketoacyl-[acyl-carrier-protein] synthase family protein [Saccharothrix sp. S26]|uniref:beta-ketoacyl-[acyl-carrier-protein] synthase family protein n=1 Tax=Saccharothrix sp. S26 TaxID=2907215 RepID=UPI001F3F9221|nr:beta-ketoacyl-[acyl-carrier-protein] synthase family protein [Saccharothrix sp. S26]MCE6996342.1 beta-ketoacyl-[acyl-carrier-protein] synthase family protein [Saccharothrix sp. S26]
MNADDVVVTGLGLISPAGIGVADNWKGVLSGRSAAASDPELAGLPVDFSCRVPGFDITDHLDRRVAFKLDRATQLAVVAAREAVADAGLDPRSWDGARVAVVLGTSMGGVGSMEREHAKMLQEGHSWVSPLVWVMSPVNMIPAAVAMDLGARGPNLCAATACASGPTAVGTARQLLRAGMCDIAIAGAADAPLTRMTMAGLAQMGALSTRADDIAAASRPFDRHRDGMVVAEAAGVLVLERSADAGARGARVRAKVAGYGATCDAHHLSAPDPSGRAVEAALRQALTDADLSPQDIDHVNAHGSSTPLNDVTEARVVRRVLGDRALVTSTKGVTGHALGAAGAIEAAYTVLALQEDTVPPTANLDALDEEVELDVVAKEPRTAPLRAAVTNSFGFGGQNGVLVLTAP